MNYQLPLRPTQGMKFKLPGVWDSHQSPTQITIFRVCVMGGGGGGGVRAYRFHVQNRGTDHGLSAPQIALQPLEEDSQSFPADHHCIVHIK